MVFPSLRMGEVARNRPWLRSIRKGTRGCCFYTTEEEFFSLAAPFLREGLSAKEACCWILPPHLTFSEGLRQLEERLGSSLRPLIKNKSLLPIRWDNWYGTENSIQQLLHRNERLFEDALQRGFSGLRWLSHSPHKLSPYWKDFYLYEEAFAKRFKSKAVISLCAYSVIDCPASAISSIATNYPLCLIHRGSDWEWLGQIGPSKQLPSATHHYR